MEEQKVLRQYNKINKPLTRRGKRCPNKRFRNKSQEGDETINKIHDKNETR